MKAAVGRRNQERVCSRFSNREVLLPVPNAEFLLKEESLWLKLRLKSVDLDHFNSQKHPEFSQPHKVFDKNKQIKQVALRTYLYSQTIPRAHRSPVSSKGPTPNLSGSLLEAVCIRSRTSHHLFIRQASILCLAQCKYLACFKWGISTLPSSSTFVLLVRKDYHFQP